jgi:methylglutaconyl-CoA hydratase
MNLEFVNYECRERIGYITLNRPEKRNALNAEFVAQLKEVFEFAESDPGCKVIILRANGEAFCAGADLAYIQQLQDNSYAENLADSRHLMELFRSIYLSAKVVIAQVNGPALAGGSGLATLCDFCFATPASKFGYTEVKIGFIPAIVMVFLSRKISEGRARDLLLTGRLIESEEALQYGLIHEVVPEAGLAERVRDFAAKLVREASGNSLSTIKKMLAEVQNLDLDTGLDYASEMNALTRESEDCKKGIAAFLAKEKLSW